MCVILPRVVHCVWCQTISRWLECPEQVRVMYHHLDFTCNGAICCHLRKGTLHFGDVCDLDVAKSLHTVRNAGEPDSLPPLRRPHTDLATLRAYPRHKCTDTRLNYCHVSSLTPRNWTFPKSLRVIFVHGSLGHLVAGCTSSPDWPTHENDIFHPSPIMVTLPLFEYIGHKSGMCPFCVILNRCSRIESLGMHPTYKHNTQVVH